MSGEDAFAAMVRVSEEAGLYEATADATVCVTHGRFVPCRKQDGCMFSSDPAEVERIRIQQEF